MQQFRHICIIIAWLLDLQTESEGPACESLHELMAGTELAEYGHRTDPAWVGIL